MTEELQILTEEFSVDLGSFFYAGENRMPIVCEM